MKSFKKYLQEQELESFTGLSSNETQMSNIQNPKKDNIKVIDASTRVSDYFRNVIHDLIKENMISASDVKGKSQETISKSVSNRLRERFNQLFKLFNNADQIEQIAILSQMLNINTKLQLLQIFRTRGN